MRITTYIEGVESFGQALCRPLTISLGSSYDKHNKKYEPSLLTKITYIVLAIISLPLSAPLIVLGCVLVACSQEHKKRFVQISDNQQRLIRQNLSLVKGKASDRDLQDIVQKITTYERISSLSSQARDLPRLLQEIIGLVEPLKDDPALQEPLTALHSYA